MNSGTEPPGASDIAIPQLSARAARVSGDCCTRPELAECAVLPSGSSGHFVCWKSSALCLHCNYNILQHAIMARRDPKSQWVRWVRWVSESVTYCDFFQRIQLLNSQALSHGAGGAPGNIGLGWRKLNVLPRLSSKHTSSDFSWILSDEGRWVSQWCFWNCTICLYCVMMEYHLRAPI